MRSKCDGLTGLARPAYEQLSRATVRRATWVGGRRAFRRIDRLFAFAFFGPLIVARLTLVGAEIEIEQIHVEEGLGRAMPSGSLPDRGVITGVLLRPVLYVVGQFLSPSPALPGLVAVAGNVSV